MCGRKLGLQVDHRKQRSKGGRTRKKNLGTLCKLCHSFKTQGLLSLEKTRDGGYIVTRHVEGLTDDLEPAGKEVEALPLVAVAAASTRVNGTGQYTRVDGAPQRGAGRLDELVQALRGLGFRKDEARRRIERAFEKLWASGRASPADEDVLRAAISGG